jgi:hypothetical protein
LLDPTTSSDLTTGAEDVETRSTSSAGRNLPTQWWRSPQPTARLEVISGFQKWDGRVVEVDDSSFVAELLPLDDASGSQPVYADFESHLLEPERVAVGDIIYVTARMVENGRGIPPSKTLAVRLRRIGNWTPAELESIAAEVKQEWAELKDLFD